MKSLQGRDGGEGGRGGTTYGDSTRGTTLLMPPTLTVRRGGDPGELHLSGFAGDCVTQVSPASGIEGGTGNQNLSAAAGPRWCVPCTFVVHPAPSLVVGERLGESSTFEYGRRIRDGEHERARREWWVSGPLPRFEASPGEYIGTLAQGFRQWSICLEYPWHPALSELGKGPGEKGGAGGHTRHAGGVVWASLLRALVLGEMGGGDDNARAKGKRRASGAETMIKMAETTQCHEKPEPGRTQATLPSLSCVALRRWGRSPGHQALSAAPFRPLLSPFVPEQDHRAQEPDHRAQEPDHRPRERPGYTVAVIFS